MTILVTGSAGHLGEALMRTFRANGTQARGLDLKQSNFTQHVGSTADRAFVQRAIGGVCAVIHAAALHKPHVATHGKRGFVDTNAKARADLGWQPRYDFRHVLDYLRADRDFRSDLAIAIGSKGYHAETFAHGPYPVS